VQHVWLAPGVGGAVGAAAARSPHLAGAPAAPPGSRAAAPGATARARTARAQRKCRPGRGRRTGQGLGRVRSVTPGRGRRTPSPQVREPRPTQRVDQRVRARWVLTVRFWSMPASSGADRCRTAACRPSTCYPNQQLLPQAPSETLLQHSRELAATEAQASASAGAVSGGRSPGSSPGAGQRHRAGPAAGATASGRWERRPRERPRAARIGWIRIRTRIKSAPRTAWRARRRSRGPAPRARPGPPAARPPATARSNAPCPGARARAAKVGRVRCSRHRQAGRPHQLRSAQQAAVSHPPAHAGGGLGGRSSHAEPLGDVASGPARGHPHPDPHTQQGPAPGWPQPAAGPVCGRAPCG